MRSQSVTLSFVFHMLVVLSAIITLPWLKRDFDIPEPISVELVTIDMLTQTKLVAPPRPPDAKPEEQKKPPPAAKNNADDAVVPVKKPVDDKPAKREEVVAKEAPVKKVEKKKEEKKEVEEKPRDFASVLKNLEVQDKKAAPPELAQNAPLGDKMTMREEDALRRQLERCWSVPFGARDAENLIVEIAMVIAPDRTLRAARVVDTGRYNRDSFFRAAADSAMRAVQSPLCSPFELPPDKYDVWKETTVTFNPKEMF